MLQKKGVWYLGHSGFAVDTGAHFLIFDYYLNNPGGKPRSLAAGVIEPAEIAEKNVVAFSSHRHADHFNRRILGWQGKLPHLSYVLSDDIPAAKKMSGILAAAPGQTYDADGVKIQTLRSTDEGVAFVVEADGCTLYHAGDLNWWHWEGEPEKDNTRMAERYRAEIDKLAGRSFDAAFVPVDPRLEKQALWGLSYFMQKADARMIFPMHFWEKYEIFDRLRNDPDTAPYRARICTITHRGQFFPFPSNG